MWPKLSANKHICFFFYFSWGNFNLYIIFHFVASIGEFSSVHPLVCLQNGTVMHGKNFQTATCKNFFISGGLVDSVLKKNLFCPIVILAWVPWRFFSLAHICCRNCFCSIHSKYFFFNLYFLKRNNRIWTSNVHEIEDWRRNIVKGWRDRLIIEDDIIFSQR